MTFPIATASFMAGAYSIGEPHDTRQRRFRSLCRRRNVEQCSERRGDTQHVQHFVAGAALDPPPANFTDPAFWDDPVRADNVRERIITVVRDGGTAIGVSALMAPWGALYNEEQLEEMADYVLSFRPNE